ncbi:MAG: GtrA family protein [Clostridia bacterium]|nr:GtrA family protein [Clostridia bacterium]
MIKKLISKYSDLIPYAVFGALTTLIDFAIYYLLYTYCGINNILSTITAFIAAVLFAFVTNKLFVFKSKSWDKLVALPEFLKFIAARIGTFIFTVLFMYITVDLFKLNGPLMKIIQNVIVIILNYIFSKYMIFKGV